MERGLGQMGNRVLMREPVFASLARASLWPTGHSGGGFLLGSVSGPHIAVAGLIQTWYQSHRGRLFQQSLAEHNQIAQSYPIIGTFTIGSPSGTPTPHLIVTTMAGSTLAVEADRGRVGVLQAGGAVDLVLTNDPADMPVLLGRNGDPGLQGTPERKPVLLMAGSVAVVSLVLLAGVTMGWQEPAGQSGLPAEQVAAPPAVDVPPAPGDETPPDELAVAGEPARPTWPAESALLLRHLVQEGETLSEIGIRYYNSSEHAEIIRRANELPDSRIDAGTVLTIPLVE